MQGPSLEGLKASTDAADTTEYTSRQKLAVVLGVAAIGTYIGYTLVQSYKGETPQAIWTNTTKTNASASSTATPQIAIVNLPEEVRPIAREGLQGWLDVHNEVQLTFPTVMLVEEEETSTLADIGGGVRRATLYAHKELHEARQKQKSSSSSSTQTPPPLCTVVYRTIIEVEGQTLEDWDVDASGLRKWHQKAFTQRHCLGFTVDGRNVTLLTQDVEGIFRTGEFVSAAKHSGATLLRECRAPSTATFRRWWPSAATRTTASASMLSFDSSKRKDDRADALKAFERSGRLAALWRDPFSLFSLLGTVLRYNRPEAAVFPALLSPNAVRPNSPNTPNRLWRVVGEWPRRLRVPLLRRADEDEKRRRERRRVLSAPFLIAANAVESSPAPPTAIVQEVQTCTAQWVRHFATLVPEHEAALVEVQREDSKRWGLRVDLTRVQCTVVEAAWLLTHVVGLLAAVGVSLADAKLVVIPATQSNTSLLYPTADSEHVSHYWKPCKPSPSASSTVGVGSRLSTSPSALQHTGWISVELRAEKRRGFVVAEHDFASL
ncbi:hypothetical protein ABB37_07647 [Leptomonas pyrrhocoris]|uniref:Uncharacterized protein n=1 Tax=Leptomonas pyrrhocoris TaxID=157538 RepID=A0A0M9FVK0_LEPPY|nr:hypothetical protein ABB37_07647 [Leptomonas pyrrhocoris]KPA76849.1 hypothetical protein ABB37_07647 [Leptomonas pyrrhocoris]|eukprot:XP_015655288.1 hypothetical protein ABB37_07647 [Leptomonas pyrrhocoris]